jgi:hypothetical protein
MKAAELQEALERSIILSRGHDRDRSSQLQQWSRSLRKSLDSHLYASSCSKGKHDQKASSSYSKSMEVGTVGGICEQEQQQSPGEVSCSSSGWGAWAMRRGSRGKLTEQEQHSRSSGRGSRGGLPLPSRYAAHAGAVAASRSCSSFSRSSFARASLRDSQVLTSGEMQIGSVCASLKVRQYRTVNCNVDTTLGHVTDLAASHHSLRWQLMGCPEHSRVMWHTASQYYCMWLACLVANNVLP